MQMQRARDGVGCYSADKVAKVYREWAPTCLPSPDRLQLSISRLAGDLIEKLQLVLPSFEIKRRLHDLWRIDPTEPE